ncbi:MAG: hypothetical protein AB7O88_19270 [Reyranellaceae bacterium]
MDSIASALADPAGRTIYLVFCILLLIAPMTALAIWYRVRIRRLPGGPALQREQERIGVRTSRSWQAIGMARDVAAGRYGADVRTLINTLYVAAAIWALVNAVAFGVLFWADEVNRP